KMRLLAASVTFALPLKKTNSEEFLMDAISAKCGHLKRRLKRNERLTGELLEFALDVAWDEEIARKLIAGETLTDYERHIMVDVVLLHVRLAPR
ncbi:hypothetical protein, partial [Herbaspirillum sp. RV1423]